MRIDIKGQEIDDWESIRRYVTGRLRFVLSRFGGQIVQVGVRLERIQTVPGEVDVECRLTVRLVSGSNILVEVPDANPYAAVDQAAERARRLVNLRLASPDTAVPGRTLGASSPVGVATSDPGNDPRGRSNKGRSLWTSRSR